MKLDDCIRIIAIKEDTVGDSFIENPQEILKFNDGNLYAVVYNDHVMCDMTPVHHSDLCAEPVVRYH